MSKTWAMAFCFLIGLFVGGVLGASLVWQQKALDDGYASRFIMDLTKQLDECQRQAKGEKKAGPERDQQTGNP